jgi:uncharacterized protein YceK
MRSIAVAALSIVLLSGCSTTASLVSPTEANQKVGDGSAVLNLRSGRSYRCRDVQVGMDSTRFVDRTTDSVVVVQTHDLKSVEVTHHAGGALEGLLFGGIGGAGFGLLAGSGMGQGGDEGMGKGLLVLATTVVGATGGVIIGVIKGHNYTFIFPP